MNKKLTILAIANVCFCADALAQADDVGKRPDSFPVTVINDALNPVPVAGEVTGTVDVLSVPTTLTDRLDLVLDELEALNDSVQATGYPRASYVEYMQFQQEGCGGQLCSPPPVRQFAQPIWASFITVSTENDDGFIEFVTEGSSIPVLRFGHRNRQLPGVITASLPQAVRISAVSFLCNNLVEDCEVAISVVGEIAE